LDGRNQIPAARRDVEATQGDHFRALGLWGVHDAIEHTRTNDVAHDLQERPGRNEAGDEADTQDHQGIEPPDETKQRVGIGHDVTPRWGGMRKTGARAG
jgi:hypothetical protein